MKNNILKNPRFYISVLLVLFFFFFAVQVPYSHDDWQWGSHSSWLLMLNGFANYNGRYLGNLFEILITRSVLAKNIALTVGMFFIIYTVYRLVVKECKPKDKTALFLLTAVLCLSLPREIFRQTYSWIAAFINFIPPVILIVLYLIIVDDIFEENNLNRVKLNRPIWLVLLMIPFGISAQLFSEHTTAYLVFLAAFIVFYTFVKYRKVSPLQVVFLIAVIIGALIMFTNGAYFNAANDTDGYKKISFSIASIIDLYTNQMSDTLFLNNWLLNTILALLCIFIVLINLKNTSYIGNKVVGNIQVFILSTYMVYGVINKVYPAWNIFTNTQKTSYFNALYSLLFFVCILSVILLYIENNGLKMKMFMIYGSSLALAMPLVIANPIGPRCFFASYIFMVITALQLLLYLVNWYNFNLSNFTTVIAGILVTICAFYASIFIDVGISERSRVEIINNAVKNGEKSITLHYLPYSDYYWTTVPPNDHWAKFFKEFYHIPQDVQLYFK